MNYENQDIEINLKSMFFSALYQWKKLLILAIVFALILGGYKGFSGFSLLNDPEKAAEVKQDYEDDLAYYESKLEELEANVDTLKDSRDDQREYLANSVLMQINASNVAEAKASVYISTDYQIIPNSFYQNPDIRASVIHAYKSIILSDTLLDNITKETGLETRYLKELVTIPEKEEGEAVDTGTIDIYVVHKDLASAESILNTILSYIENTQPMISQSIGNHKLNIISKTSGFSVYPELSTTQANAKLQLTTIEQELFTTEATLENLAEPKKAILEATDVIVDITLWVIIGTIVGGILGVVWYCFSFLLSSKLYSDDELKARFQARVLGSVLVSDKKLDTITIHLRKKEGRIISNTPENLDVIVASVNNYCKDNGTLLLTGDADRAIIESLGSKLANRLPQIKIISCGSLLKDATAVNALTNCDYVLTVAQCNVSTYNNIKEELKRIQDFKKNYIGYIVIE